MNREIVFESNGYTVTYTLKYEGSLTNTNHSDLLIKTLIKLTALGIDTKPLEKWTSAL